MNLKLGRKTTLIAAGIGNRAAVQLAGDKPAFRVPRNRALSGRNPGRTSARAFPGFSLQSSARMVRPTQTLGVQPLHSGKGNGCFGNACFINSTNVPVVDTQAEGGIEVPRPWLAPIQNALASNQAALIERSVPRLR
ncbi:MAG: hypothetical protein ABI440_07890 [Casimicrobiaceae bacterium]